jgi:hypothetical protein
VDAELSAADEALFAALKQLLRRRRGQAQGLRPALPGRDRRVRGKPGRLGEPRALAAGAGPTCRPCPRGRQAGSRRRTGTTLTEIEYQRWRACPIMRTCLADANELAPNASLHARFQIDSGHSGKQVRRACCSQMQNLRSSLVAPDTLPPMSGYHLTRDLIFRLRAH